MENRIPFYKSSRFAALAAAFLIVLGSLVGAGRSLGRLKSGVEQAFYLGVDGGGYSIQSGLDERIIGATNLITVARRYLDEDNAVLVSLIRARDALASAGTIPDKYDANARLSAAVADMGAELSKRTLSESDAKYAKSIPADMQSRNDTLSRDGYNQEAARLNEALGRFPARLFALALGIEEAEYFR